MNFKSMNSNHWRVAIFSVLAGLHVAAACRGARILRSGVTEDEKRLILEEHNYLRQTVATGHVPGQPSAQNMQEMTWDDELAAKAQQWANECTFQHDPSRYLGRFIMGQNLGLLWSTAYLAEDDGDFPSRIRNWFNEVQKYAWGAKWSVKTGHYSQLVWGDTNLVGCGFTYYQDPKLYSKLYVCNYGPGGNVVGVKPYETGSPKCRNFGMSDSAKYPGLCTPYEEVPQNVGSAYELALNSISAQQKAPTYFTYKTYNTGYDNERMVGTSSSTRNNVQSTFTNQNYNANSNNEVHSYSRNAESKAANQQQYSNQHAQQPSPTPPRQPPQSQAKTPFQQAFNVFNTQNQQRRTIDSKNPFHTYQWNLLFKNYL